MPDPDVQSETSDESFRNEICDTVEYNRDYERRVTIFSGLSDNLHTDGFSRFLFKMRPMRKEHGDSGGDTSSQGQSRQGSSGTSSSKGKSQKDSGRGSSGSGGGSFALQSKTAGGVPTSQALSNILATQDINEDSIGGEEPSVAKIGEPTRGGVKQCPEKQKDHGPPCESNSLKNE